MLLSHSPNVAKQSFGDKRVPKLEPVVFGSGCAARELRRRGQGDDRWSGLLPP